ncbi:MAG: exo-alpha-sialidase [Bacteroidales bacterium]|nr:exo-alpha-sialidase [Bacteroidales bacterium]
MKKIIILLSAYLRYGNIWKSVILSAVLCINFSLVNADPPQKRAEKSIFTSEHVFPLQSQHVHGSSLVELPNGDLLCCWFEGSGERTANDVVIKGARQHKGESGWSTPFIMADTQNNPDCNPVLFIDNNNRLHLSWIVVVANQWERSILKTRISTDYQNEGAPKWQWQDIVLLKPGEEFAKTIEQKFRELKTPEPAWAAYAPIYEKMIIEAAKDASKREVGWMTRIHPLILPSGRILLPLYSDGFNVSLTAISDDNGDTWSPSLPIVGRGNVQPSILRKKDGTLVAYMRDNGDAPGRIIESISKDNGYEWSVTHKTDLPNPGSSVEAISLKDGRWLLVHNDREEGRHRLAVSLSDDEGKTWKVTKYLENVQKGEGSFSYPSVIQGKDGLIHITYSYHLKDKKTIKHVCFPASWAEGKDIKITNAEKLGFPAGKKVILLHIDDAGMCDEANIATRHYFETGDLRSTAVMVPCPYAEDLIKWAKKQKSPDIGIHLTLTSEWKNYRWGPVADPDKVPGLIDPEGKLWHDVPDVVMHASAEEVETEVRAQIDKVLAMGYTPTHIDTHMGTLYGSAEYVKVFLKIAAEYNIPANAIDLSDTVIAENFRKEGYPVTGEVVELLNQYALPKLDNFSSVPDGKSYEEKRAGFFALVTSLNAGLTEIIFHPSVETDNLKTITNSWQQRVWEAQLFSDPAVRNFFADEGVVITTWKEIMERHKKRN